MAELINEQVPNVEPLQSIEQPNVQPVQPLTAPPKPTQNQITLQDYLNEANKISRRKAQLAAQPVTEAFQKGQEGFLRNLYSQNVGASSGVGQQLAGRTLESYQKALTPIVEQVGLEGMQKELGYRQDMDRTKQLEALNIGAEQRAEQRDIRSEQRSEDRQQRLFELENKYQLSAEERAEKRQIESELRSEGRTISAEQRAEARQNRLFEIENKLQINAEERAEARQIRADIRAEARNNRIMELENKYNISAEERAELRDIRNDQRNYNNTLELRRLENQEQLSSEERAYKRQLEINNIQYQREKEMQNTAYQRNLSAEERAVQRQNEINEIQRARELMDQQFALVEQGRITGEEAKKILAERGINPENYMTETERTKQEIENDFKQTLESTVKDKATRELIDNRAELEYFMNNGTTYEDTVANIIDNTKSLNDWKAKVPELKTALNAARNSLRDQESKWLPWDRDAKKVARLKQQIAVLEETMNMIDAGQAPGTEASATLETIGTPTSTGSRLRDFENTATGA